MPFNLYLFFFFEFATKKLKWFLSCQHAVINRVCKYNLIWYLARLFVSTQHRFISWVLEGFFYAWMIHISELSGLTNQNIPLNIVWIWAGGKTRGKIWQKQTLTRTSDCFIRSEEMRDQSRFLHSIVGGTDCCQKSFSVKCNRFSLFALGFIPLIAPYRPCFSHLLPAPSLVLCCVVVYCAELAVVGLRLWLSSGLCVALWVYGSPWAPADSKPGIPRSVSTCLPVQETRRYLCSSVSEMTSLVTHAHTDGCM